MDIHIGHDNFIDTLQGLTVSLECVRGRFPSFFLHFGSTLVFGFGPLQASTFSILLFFSSDALLWMQMQAMVFILGGQSIGQPCSGAKVGTFKVSR
jgi:hypothetical protein